MKNRSGIRLVSAIGVAVVFWACTAARAELPPSAYVSMQKDAPEAVQIEVLRVDGQVNLGPEEQSNLTVFAKVVCIGRSASGLKPGDAITIVYSTVLKRSFGWVGPRPLPVLKAGQYPAFLARQGAQFVPAAQGYSFSPPPDKPVISAYKVCAPQ
jgi:hypothetical protein